MTRMTFCYYLAFGSYNIFVISFGIMYLSFSYICKYGLFCNLFVPVNKNIAQTLFTYFGWQQCINAMNFLSLTCDFALLRNSVTICTKYWSHQFWQHKPDIKEKMLLPRQTNNSDWCILKSFTSFKSGMRYKTKNSINILVLKIDPSTVNPHAHPEHLLVAVCYYTLQISLKNHLMSYSLLYHWQICRKPYILICEPWINMYNCIVLTTLQFLWINVCIKWYGAS